MSEVAEIKQPETAASEAPIMANPFDDSSWTSEPPKPVEHQTQQPTTTQQESQEPTPVTEAKESNVIDANEYLKQQLGYDDWDAAKTELQQLRELREKAQTPADLKFANEQSQKFFDALKEGKVDDVYSFLHQQKQLERLEKLDLSSANEAAEIIKANLQFKNPELTSKEVDFLYKKRYAIPQQPKQGLDQSDEEYNAVLEDWKEAVQEKEQEIIIEAKLARPELAKYRSELVLPDIPKADAVQPQAPDPKVLEDAEAARNAFLKTVDSEYSKFSGYETKVKDESVELPVTFTVPDEEKLAYANKLKDFDINVFFEERWFPKGQPNVNQMMADLYLLENPGKVLQGMANNAASKRLENHLKTKSNIKVDGGSSPATAFTPSAKDVQVKQEETLWGD